jgi:hypothetical protein
MAVRSTTRTIRAGRPVVGTRALAIAACLWAAAAGAQDDDFGGDFNDDVYDSDPDDGDLGDDSRFPDGDEEGNDAASDDDDDRLTPLPLDRDDRAEPGTTDRSPTSTPNVPTPLGQQVPRQTRFFRDLSTSLPQVELTAVAVDPGDPEVILVGADGFVFKSDDGGESWRPTLSFARGLASDLLVEDPDEIDDPADGPLDPDLLVQDRNIQPVDENDLQQSPETTQIPMLINPNDGMPDGDFDDVASGPTAAEGIGVRAITFVSSSEGTVFVGSPRGVWRSVDVGESWQRLQVPGGSAANDVRAIAVHPDRPSRVWMATRSGLLLSPDGGQSFQAVATGGRVPALSVVTATVLEQRVVVVGTDRGVWRSWDDGKSFRKLLLQGVSANEPVGVLAVDPAAAVFYAGTPSGLFAAERRVAILESRPLFENQHVVALSIDAQRPRGAAIGVLHQGLVLTEDTGLSLVPLSEVFPARTARGIDRLGDDPDALVIATPRGVFVHAQGSGVQVLSDRYRALQQLFMAEPTLAELVEEALRHQRVHPERMANIEERTRLRALAPQMSFLYRLTWGRPEEQEEYVIVGDEPDDYDEDNAQDLQELYDLGIAQRAPQVGLNHRLWLQATWNLDGFIFTADEPRARGHRVMQRVEERRVAGQVQELYTARRRLILEMVDAGADHNLASMTRQRVRLDELTALLDGASGGAFTRISQERGADLKVLFDTRR